MPNKETAERRRATDPQPVEVRGYSNGAKWGELIQTVTQVGTLIASLSILISVIWWASKIDTQQGVMTEDVTALEVEAKEAAVERRELAEHLGAVAVALTKVTETLERTVVRLDDTRDIALGRDTTKPAAP